MAKTRVGLPQPIGMEVEGEREAVAGGWPKEAAPMLPAAAFPGTPKGPVLGSPAWQHHLHGDS